MIPDLHTALSRHVLVPWIVDGPWGARRRAYADEVYAARRGFADWAALDAEGRRDRALADLREAARFAARRVPWYRAAFQAAGFDAEADFGFADWRRLPPLDKDVLRDRPGDLLAEGFPADLLVRNATGGSTGAPVHFLQDPGDQAWRAAAQEWAFGLAGFRRGDRTAMLWGAQVEPSMRPSLRSRVVGWMVNREVLDCFRLSPEVLDAYHDRLAAFRPEVLLAYASALALLAGRLRERGLAPSYPRRACITGAEKLRPDQRAVVESVFAAPVWESYGSRDCGTMAIRPSGDAPYRVAGAAVLLEPWGEPDEAGAREVLVTVLHGRGMPLLRYRIGDRARFGDVPADGPVECLPDVTGRVVDHLRLPDGRRVDGLQFPHFFKDFDVREYRVVQAADGSVRASLVPGPGLGAGDLERIDRVLRANLPGLPVAVETVEELPRNAAGKLRSVVSLYDPGVP